MNPLCTKVRLAFLVAGMTIFCWRGVSANDFPENRIEAFQQGSSVAIRWSLPEFASSPWGVNLYRFAGGVTGIPERVNLMPIDGGSIGVESDGGLRVGETYMYRVSIIDSQGRESWLAGEAFIRFADLPGDVDLLSDDRGILKVDGLDLLKVHEVFGSSAGESQYLPCADLDGNGVVDGVDLDIVSRNIGKFKATPIP